MNENTSVKISVAYGENISSGIVLTIENKYYVLTCYHCIVVNDTDVPNRDLLTIEYFEKFDSPDPEILNVIEITDFNSKVDYAILEIHKPNINIVYPKFAQPKNELSGYSFKGFSAKNLNSPREFPVRVKDISTHGFLCALSEDTLFQAIEFGHDVAKGLSGSGVCYTIQNEKYLIGIVKQLRDAQGTFNDFFGVNIECIPFFNNLLQVLPESSQIIQQVIINSHDYKQIKERIEELEADIEDISDVSRLEKKRELLQKERAKLTNLEKSVTNLYNELSQARYNFDFINEAKEEFYKGNFEKARDILSSDKLKNKSDDLLVQEENLKDELAKIQDSKREISKGFLFKALLESINYDNIERVNYSISLFKKSIEFDDNFENKFSYANFLSDNNLFEESLEVWNKIEQNMKMLDAEKNFAVSMNLMNLCLNMNDYDNAKKYYEQAKLLRENISDDVYNTFIINSTELNNVLGDTSEIYRDLINVIEYYKSKSDFGSEYYRALIYLATTNIKNQEFNEAERLLLEVAKSAYFEEYKSSYYLNLSKCYDDWADLFKNNDVDYTDKINKARKYFEEGEKYFQDKVNISSDNVRLKYGQFLNNYGHFINKHSPLSPYSDILLSKSLEIRKEFFNKGIDAHDADYAQALNIYSNSLFKKGDKDQAFKGWDEVLEIYQRLALKFPKVYQLDVAMVMYNLAEINRCFYNDLAKSKEYCNQIISSMEPFLKQISMSEIDTNADIESFPRPFKYTLGAMQIIASIEGKYYAEVVFEDKTINIKY
ncbi:coiled-coil domain-containing protein [Sphingobacterium endophyticum]|uniref:hypothetical protein n=1 Tax=Sphingobacterium endophyticum TaxID=2546448 RepID=UPI0012E1ACFC|nr:hypothetical protein [Sphingobacterium endophyticum]